MTANLPEDFGDSPSVEEIFNPADEVDWDEINRYDQQLDTQLPEPVDSNEQRGRFVTEEYLQYVDGVVTNWLAHNDV